MPQTDIEELKAAYVFFGSIALTKTKVTEVVGKTNGEPEGASVFIAFDGEARQFLHSNFQLSVRGNPILTTRSFKDVIVAYVASYFVFRLPCHKQIVTLMTFFEKALLGIEYAHQPKTKVTTVVNLLNKLN